MNETTTDTSGTSISPALFSLTSRAAKRINALTATEVDQDSFLRVSVQGGGCSGFQYALAFDKVLTPDDHVFTLDGARVAVDATSLGLLSGSELDYVEDLMGAMFVINNPNATSGCGCGNSFSVF